MMYLKNVSQFVAAITLVLFFSCRKNDEANTLQDPPDTTVTGEIDTALYTISGHGGSAPGEIFLAFNSSATSTHALAILDHNGYIKKKLPMPYEVENLQKWVFNGTTRYTYLHTADNFMGQGYFAICDTGFNVIKELKLLSHNDIDASADDRLDEHDFILLGDNHYIYMANYVVQPKNIPDSLHPDANVKVYANVIQEVENDQVIFQWVSTEHPELYANSVENNDYSNATTVLDYMHLNSICIDSSDNNLILSFRNMDEVIKINRQTGATMWQLGGKHSDFPLAANQYFLRQHYPRFTDNGKTLTLLDNGDINLRPSSRVLEFQLDEINKKVTAFKAYEIPDKFIRFAGSVKKIGNNYFIGGGSAAYTLEVNYVTNDVVLRLNQNPTSYRSYKYEY